MALDSVESKFVEKLRVPIETMAKGLKEMEDAILWRTRYDRMNCKIPPTVELYYADLRELVTDLQDFLDQQKG